MLLTSNVGSDDLGADVILEKAGDVLIVLVPLLEPEVELGGGNRVETSEIQGKVSGDGRGSRQGQESSSVRSDLEGNLGPEGDLHDGGGSDGRRVGGGSTESRGERIDGAGGGRIRRVDGDGRNLWDRREGGGVEGGDGHGGGGGDPSGSWLLSRRWREESGRNRAELCAIKDRATPAGGAPSFPTFFSDGAESRDVDVAILIDGHLGELLSERYHGSKRFRKRGAGQEDLPGSLDEGQLVDLGEAGEEEGQATASGGEDELDGDERVRRKSDDQGGFNGGQINPEAGDLDEIIGGRHYKRVRDGK